MAFQQQRSIGHMLMDRGLLSAAQLEDALAEQRRTGEKLGRVLVRTGRVRERDILSVMQGVMVVIFNLGEDEFAVESLQVREIIRSQVALALPAAPDYFEGIIKYREHVVPVINLRQRFGMPRIEVSDQSRIVIYEEPGRRVGLQVDAVSAVANIVGERLEAAPPALRGIPGHLIYGLARHEGRVVTVLQIDALLAHEDALLLTPRDRAPEAA